MLVYLLSVTAILEEDCDIECSNFVDQVCGMVTTWDGKVTISRYLNVCHLSKTKCRLRDAADVQQIPDKICRIDKHEGLRRVLDFGIVGAHQACNHTCPTYCADTYEPVCAQIWKRGTGRHTTRTMVNHCHVDLFSCSVGLNVTITPLGKCFVNPAGLLFMSQMAAMKSLGFLNSRRRVSDENDHQLDKTSYSDEDLQSDSSSNILSFLRRLKSGVL